ncbi:hypothetical protein FOQG_14852 [Fusarium oxysporum f. sp. raphani 54005]|uniref:Uncharacterized protein n=2 Tax=Fusarium oxysporum f. sp. raphani TaxID=96318 RepID=X0BFR1_FUSOX|nr:hypothetical protein FOQG_14852 [Fusarium oxysporum f. sp. raphani 54005]KAG7438435.1 hypothetical protein Forpi1262_v001977 [Fusarium oxysporum f. sp. raphani]
MSRQDVIGKLRRIINAGKSQLKLENSREDQLHLDREKPSSPLGPPSLKKCHEKQPASAQEEYEAECSCCGDLYTGLRIAQNHIRFIQEDIDHIATDIGTVVKAMEKSHKNPSKANTENAMEEIKGICKRLRDLQDDIKYRTKEVTRSE